MKKVLVIQTQMQQYRAPLWEQLNDLLHADGMRLTVAYSDPPKTGLDKCDTCDLPKEYGLRVRRYSLWENGFLYQPLLLLAARSDIVVVEQRTRLVLNHILLPLSLAGFQRVAFWGHGENRNVHAIRASEWCRQKTLNWVSWWFAYTHHTARYLETHGVSSAKITVLKNSVDTREIRDHIRSLTTENRATLREQLSIPASAPVGIFCGRLEKLKGLPFLIKSSRIIKTRLPEFHLILVGGGSEKGALLRLIEGLDWVHLVGPLFGKEKAHLMAISDVLLMPGALGLAVLDAFAAGLPVITIPSELHGPEFEYLEHGVNGFISDADPGSFAEIVSSLLSRRDYLAKFKEGASASAEKYSIENMAENFRTGIRSCLERPARGADFVGFQKTN